MPAIVASRQSKFWPPSENLTNTALMMAYFCDAPLSSIVSRVSYAPIHSVRQRPKPSRRCNSYGWGWTADRPHASWKLMIWPDLTCFSMDDVRDCIAYKNTLKYFIQLGSSSKRVTARFATWSPANRHENQIEIRSKTLLIPQTLRTRAKLVAGLVISRGVLYFDYRTHVPK